jgi:putative membrane protein insertion efficiency factor
MQHTSSKCFAARQRLSANRGGSQSGEEKIHPRLMHIQDKSSRISRGFAHGLIRAYQLTLSSLVGRQCRHLPTCSDYVDEAIAKHGIWAGGWVGFSRICRCRPWGTAGFDPVPQTLPREAHWVRPWRYGQWRGPLICEPCQETLSSRDALPSRDKS